MTSHDVVDRVRRAARQRRVGHAGTLDPMATGVLLVCLGSATRVAEYLMQAPKCYRAQTRLGIATDTYDAEGETVSERACPPLTRDQMEFCLRGFQGVLEQIPPMYSAVKVQGEPLYRLARRGIAVERKARRVEIHRIEIVSWTPPILDCMVECSAGTYVRSIAHDLGERLGCGAHLSGLARLASGEFRLEDAHPLDMVESTFANGEWRRLLLPLDSALSHFPAVALDEKQTFSVQHGQPVELVELSDGPPPPARDGARADAQIRRAYSSDGDLLALLHRKQEESNWWWPKKVFSSTP